MLGPITTEGLRVFRYRWNVKGPAEAERAFNNLAHSGVEQMSIQNTSGLRGLPCRLIKFGIPWIVMNCEQAA